MFFFINIWIWIMFEIKTKNIIWKQKLVLNINPFKVKVYLSYEIFVQKISVDFSPFLLRFFLSKHCLAYLRTYYVCEKNRKPFLSFIYFFSFFCYLKLLQVQFSGYKTEIAELNCVYRRRNPITVKSVASTSTTLRCLKIKSRLGEGGVGWV